MTKWPVGKGATGAEFSKDMKSDPNMGMNPKWRKGNKELKVKHFTIKKK